MTGLSGLNAFLFPFEPRVTIEILGPALVLDDARERVVVGIGVVPVKA